LNNILIELRIPMKLLTLIKMFVNGTYSTVCVGKYLSGTFPTKNGEGIKKKKTLSPWFFNSVLEYAIRKFQANKASLKLNGTHLLQV